MSTSLDETLRRAVRELADGAAPAPDLALRAIGQGRRLRRRRRVTATAAALVAVVAVTLPFVLLRPHATPPPTTPPTPAVTATPSPVLRAEPGADWVERPLVLPGEWVVTRAQVMGGSGSGFLLDRGRGRYFATDKYDGIYPAPTGSLVAVRDDDRPRDIGLFDLAGGKTRWYEVGRALSVPRWSPDGRRLLFTTSQVDHFGFIVLDRDGRKKTHPVGLLGWPCADACEFTWMPDGRAVALTLSRQKSEAWPRDLAKGVQLLSVDDGRPTRLIDLPGGPVGPDAWSPDGTLVVVQGHREPLLVETATGRVVNPLPSADVVWVTGDRLLYRRPFGAGDFVLADTTGRELVRQPLPRQLVDFEVTIAPH
ncbi:TolB family protein [Micromonospora sp. NPDC018662]|uniref:TolB family protein n=1 Tax=Micromonospora sp. NPDC018662 TaxID=3364238 RepID=UPI0037B4157F